MSEPENRPKILGILNITPDSFSDGGKYFAPEAAVAHGRDLIAKGADILDIGPSSSHPDAADVTAEEEIRRLAPVMEALKGLGVPLSIDTFQPETQLYALKEGAAYLNDIHGFAHEEIYPQLAASEAKLIVMHSIQAKGRATRVAAPEGDILDHISSFFEARVAALEAAGIARTRLILDPGMGFFLGSAPEVSIRALSQIGKLKERFGMPLLISVSRKSFLRRLTGREVPDIGAASLAAELFAAEAGADFIRTHDAGALRDGLLTQAALRGAARDD
ncbi:dihydropteroate synthase [Tepidicaulis sp. LMO-SS28]|uniref:dihydropteroate synthase n=1 Tax=Tepidicaulis sp. LMO-SS28 TaxID=3447455 RepID=UPI003EE24610